MNRSRTREQFDEYLWPLAGLGMSFNWSALEARTQTGAPGGFDEYLWPLDGLAVSFDWEALRERTDARQRLEAIYEHVLAMHVQAGSQHLAGASRALQLSGVVEGSPAAPLWERQLQAPVPRALRDEWNSLCEVIRGERPREAAKKTKRVRPHY